MIGFHNLIEWDPVDVVERRATGLSMSGLISVALHEDRNAVVDMDRCKRTCPLVRLELRCLGMECMHVVDSPCEPCHECVRRTGSAAIGVPVIRVQVLDDVSTRLCDMGPQSFDTCDLVLRQVAAVIDNDVPTTVFSADPVQEVRVGLVADMDPDAVFSEFAHARLDIDTDDRTPAAEIVLPHLK